MSRYINVLNMRNIRLAWLKFVAFKLDDDREGSFNTARSLLKSNRLHGNFFACNQYFSFRIKCMTRNLYCRNEAKCN